MVLSDVQSLLQCEVFSGIKFLDRRVMYGCASDLMSDVLAFSISNSLLITGLTNTQVIRTAEVATIKAIVFIQNKRPDILTISLADEKKIPLLVTDFSMFDTCGLLFEKGLRSCSDLEF